MKVINSPCLDCKDRMIEPNCHDEKRCEKWGEYIRKCQAEKDMLNEERALKKADAQRRCRLRNMKRKRK